MRKGGESSYDILWQQASRGRKKFYFVRLKQGKKSLKKGNGFSWERVLTPKIIKPKAEGH